MTGRVYTNQYTVPIEFLLAERLKQKEANWRKF